MMDTELMGQMNSLRLGKIGGGAVFWNPNVSGAHGWVKREVVEDR